jgi:DNA polymerase-3 subunit alpha
VKVRGSQIDTYAAVLTSGDPVLVTGKVSFPRRDDDAPEEAEDGPREPTLFLNEAVPLIDAVRADTRGVAIRLFTDRTTEDDLQRVAQLLSGGRGECPVSIVLALPDGAEAVLALGKSHKVEVTDALLGGLERIFGEQVAELR